MSEPAPRPPSWQRWLYVGCVALLLLPLWTVARVPTVDGPCHLYNAWVMRHVHDPAYPLLAQHYELHLDPIPNWLSQALLYALLGVAPPVLAEKLLLTLYVLLFGFAAWLHAGSVDPRRAVYALLALPFVYNWTFHVGFFNSCFGMAMYMLAVAVWWRGHREPGWRWALTLNLVMVLVYFTHMVATVLVFLTVGVLWLVSFDRVRWRAWLASALVLAPQLALPLWYLATHRGGVTPNTWSLWQRFAALGLVDMIFRFARHWAWSLAFSALVLALVVATLVVERRRRRGGDAAAPELREDRDAPAPGSAADAWPRRHAFLLAALALVGLYFVTPGGMADGSVLQPRLALFPYLAVLPGLSHRIGRRAISRVAIGVALLLAWESAELVRWHRDLARGVDRFLAGLAPVAPNTRVLALVFDRYRDQEQQVRGHALGYLAMERGLIDWDDYQAWTQVFQVRFKPGTAFPTDIEVGLEGFRIVRFAPIVDYLYTWRAPPSWLARKQLGAKYEKVHDSGEGILWKRRELRGRGARPGPRARRNPP
jgi:hypothetical protein